MNTESIYIINIETTDSMKKNIPKYFRVKGHIIKHVDKLRKDEIGVEIFSHIGGSSYSTIMSIINGEVKSYNVLRGHSNYREEKASIDFYLTCLIDGMTVADITAMRDL